MRYRVSLLQPDMETAYSESGNVCPLAKNRCLPITIWRTGIFYKHV